MELRSSRLQHLWKVFAMVVLSAALIAGEGLRLPDQQSKAGASAQPSGQHPVPPANHQQNVYNPQSQSRPQQQPPPPPPAGFGQEQGRSSILSLFGLGQDNQDPYLARTNSNCLGGDLSECFKTQALSSFDEIFYREYYPLSDFARVVRMPDQQQRSLAQEPFEYTEEVRADDSDWDQLVKYALRRAERFIKSTALEVDVPEELTEAGRYEARFIGNDIDSELEVIEDKHAPTFTRKKLKKMIIPLLLVLKIFKLKLLLFLPFILGIAGLKKILGLAAIILPGLFAYFKLCRPPGGAAGFGGGALSGLFGSKNPFPEYSPQGIGAATYYHHHEHFDGVGAGAGNGNGGYYNHQSFAKPYTDYYGKNGQNAGNSVSFGDSSAQDIAYSGYYGRNSGKDIKSQQPAAS